MPVAPKIERRFVTQPLRTGQLSTNVPIGDTSGSQNAAFKVLEAAKKTGDTLAVNEAYSVSMQEYNNLTNKALQTKGKDAHGIYEPTLKSWDTHVQDTLSGLQNDTQKNTYTAKAQALRAVMDRQLQKHASVETLRFDNQVSQDSLNSMKEAAIKNAKDDNTSGLFIQAQKDLLNEFAQRNGVDSQPLIGKAVSDTHKAIITQKLVDGNDIAATEYFKAHSQEIQDSTQLQEKLNIASTDGNAERLALQEFDGIKANALGQKDITKAINKIRRSGRSQKIKNSAIQKLKVMQSELTAHVKQEEDTKLSSVYGAIAQGATEKDIRRNPDWLNMRDGAQQEKAIKFLRIETRASSKPTDVQLLNFGNLTDDGLASMSNEALNAMAPDLGTTLLKQAINRKKRLAIESEKVNLSTENKFFAEVAAGIGVNTTKKKKSSTDKLTEAKLKSDFFEAIQKFQSTHGRPAHADEVKAIMQDVADRKTMVDGRFYGSSLEPTATLTESQISRAVPSDADKARIATVLQATGVPVTEDTTTQLFRQELKLDIPVKDILEIRQFLLSRNAGQPVSESDIQEYAIRLKRLRLGVK